MRGRHRRTTLWLLAATLLVGPSAALTGNAAECKGVRPGKDGWTRVAAPEFPETFEESPGIVGHVIVPSKVSTLVVTNGFDVMRSVDDGCTWTPSEIRSPGPTDSVGITVAIGGPSALLELDTSTFSVQSKRVYLLAKGSYVASTITLDGNEAATVGPQVYVSEDGGATFAPKLAGLPALGEPLRIRVADGVENVAYIAVADPVRGGQALYITRDAGESWAKTTGDTILPTENGSIVDFAIDPGRPDQVWAWDEETLFRSTNAGKTFTPVKEVTTPVSTIEFTAKGIGRISDVRVYRMGAAIADFSVAPSVSWSEQKAPAAITSTTSVPYVGVRVLASAQQVFSYYFNTRTQAIAGPVDISPYGVDPVDLEGGYTEKTRGAIVVGRTLTHLLRRDPRIPPGPIPPLPPIGSLGDCLPEPLGGNAFRPSAREIVLKPGERRRITYDLNLPPVPSDLDVNFMLDTTGSMSGVIAGLREDIKGIVEDICDQGVPVQFGLADFREFEGPFSGSVSTGGGGPDDPYQFPYRRRLPISPVGPELRKAIGELDTGGGATDGGDAGLEAIYQAATGAGRKDPVTGQVIIRRNEGANFRPGSLKVIVVAIDTSWREAVPGYPGPSFDTVVKELRPRGIKVVGLAIGERSSTGGLETNKQQLSRMGIATKTLAPEGGTDCDGDGAVDVEEGEPLVCVLTDPGRDAVELAPAMNGLLSALEDRASIGIELVGDPSVLAPGGTQLRNDIDVKKPSRLAFDSWFVCDEAGYGKSFPVTVNATSRGRILATTPVTVKCGVPKQDPLPAPFIAPIVAAAVPPPPPPPAPVTVTQAQPNPNPNPNPQPNPQPNVGVAAEEQEQIQVALATVDIAPEAEPEGQLAMSRVSEEDATAQVATVLLAAGLTAGAAYGLGLRRRAQPQLARVTAD